MCSYRREDDYSNGYGLRPYKNEIPHITKKKENHVIEEIDLPETYNVIVLQNSNGDKIYKCPCCKFISGTNAPKNPYDLKNFQHGFNCVNKRKIPMEME